MKIITYVLNEKMAFIDNGHSMHLITKEMLGYYMQKYSMQKIHEGQGYLTFKINEK